MSVNGKKERSKGNGFLTLLFWIYLAVLLKITVFREGFLLSGLMENGKLNLELFTAYVPFLQHGHIGLFIYLFVGNIVWFIPLGAYLVWRYPGCGVIRATLSGFLLSLGIEVSQYIFGVGVTELDDLVLNTAGTLIGALTIRVIRALTAKKRD